MHIISYMHMCEHIYVNKFSSPYATLCYTMLCRAMRCCLLVPLARLCCQRYSMRSHVFCIGLCYCLDAILCHIVRRYAILCFLMLSDDILCSLMLSYASLCHLILSYVILCGLMPQLKNWYALWYLIPYYAIGYVLKSF